MTMNRLSTILWLAVLALLLTVSPLWPQTSLAVIQDIRPEEIKSAGFSLSSEQDLDITAVGAHRRDRHSLVSTAWILNADTRAIVWELTDANSRWLSRKLREYGDSVRLPAGNYEVFFATYMRDYYDRSWSFGKFFFGLKDDDYYDDVYDEFRIEVTGNGRSLSASRLREIREQVKERAVLDLTISHPDEYREQGFELTAPMDLIVYCIGEARDDGVFDYGWIMNATSRERVWSFEYRDSEHAGGSSKNRMVRETITLPAGKYVAYYVSDDSHTPDKWNSMPPFDPDFYGLTLFAADPDRRNRVKPYDYEDMPAANVIIDFSRMRDDAYVSKGFTLKKDMDLRIYALGEGVGRDMYDYGWIVDARDHRRVWEMQFRDTEHAGGNHKNRLYDEVQRFDKGDYIAYYVTDGSHSYADWNASPPFDQEKWGMTIVAVDDDFEADDVAEYSPDEDRSILVRLNQVRDWETRKERFSLNRDSKVRIYAVGEGSEGRMYDYGWIESLSKNQIVWEMTYRKTEHAGGADKNRMFNGTILLPAGDYMVYFESDDSHSFRDWNASPPRDPGGWGITLYRVDD